MTLQSMTGFGRAAADHDGVAIAWEVRSVNGKSLEARLRLPQGHERLEQAARQALQKRFARGNIQASLTIAYPADRARPVINELFLVELAALAKRLEADFALAPARADGILALRGVIEPAEPDQDEETRQRLDAAILGALDKALQALEKARREEGAALATFFRGQLDMIAELTDRAEADPARAIEAIREKLSEQVRRLMEANGSLDEGRLAQEAAILATKADIREEIDRLRTHVASARAMIASGGPIGRKLDFLAQEFNRESNTLCSKANAASITAIGLELKSVVDQFREQVQNLE
jgi:uncharacterized protein (TIGR00255 family)